MLALQKRLDTAPAHIWPSQPVSLALVITDLDVGGAEKTLVALATRLDRSRWRPSVIGLSAEGTLCSILREAGVEVRTLGASPRRPLQAVVRLRRALRETLPRLVQSFLFHANVACRFASSGWILGGIRVAEREKGWHLVLDRLTQQLATGSVCVSETLKRFSIEHGQLDPRRLTVIPNGVDTALMEQARAVSRESLGVPQNAFLTLFAGRLDRQKGVDVLLDAAPLVLDSRPEWHLALAGDGPMREEVVGRIAGDERLSQRVHWLGRRDDVPGLMKASDLLVLPSRWEGMPNVVLEAMAIGRAVVGTRVEGTSELVVPGETGWLVPQDDKAALARAILDASSNPEITRRLGDAARQRVAKQFSIDRMVESYEQLWARVLGLAWPPLPC